MLDEYAVKLRANVVASTLTAAKPFRALYLGPMNPYSFPRPFLTLSLTRLVPIASASDDRVFTVHVHLGIATDVKETDANDEILDKIAAVEDYLDSIRTTGVKEGANGFDLNAWDITWPDASTTSRVATAIAKQEVIVKVKRGENRAVT